MGPRCEMDLADLEVGEVDHDFGGGASFRLEQPFGRVHEMEECCNCLIPDEDRFKNAIAKCVKAHSFRNE